MTIIAEIGVLALLGVISWMMYAYTRPYTVFNKYMNAFKIGLLSQAADKNNIDLEQIVKKHKYKDIETIIQDKVEKALSVEKEEK